MVASIKVGTVHPCLSRTQILRDVNTDSLASLPTKLEGGNPRMVQGPSVAHSPMYSWNLQGMKHYHIKKLKVSNCTPPKPRTIGQGE